MQPLPLHLQRCSLFHSAARDVAAAAVDFGGRGSVDGRRRATCDLRQLADIRVAADLANSSIISTTLCITSQDPHRLLLPIFWGKNPLVAPLFVPLCSALVFILVSPAGAPTVPPMARWGECWSCPRVVIVRLLIDVSQATVFKLVPFFHAGKQMIGRVAKRSAREETTQLQSSQLTLSAMLSGG